MFLPYKNPPVISAFTFVNIEKIYQVSLLILILRDMNIKERG